MLAEAGGEITLDVFNLIGEKIRQVARWNAAQGLPYTYFWDGRNENGELLGTGAYLILMKTARGNTVTKVIILREGG